MSAEWNCGVCGTSVLGSTCPNESNQDHRIAALEARTQQAEAQLSEVVVEDVVDDETLTPLMRGTPQLPRYVSELRQRLAALEAENFALAANQCHDGYGDDRGNHRCRYQDRIAALEAELAEQEQEGDGGYIDPGPLFCVLGWWRM